jgi:hypothetical protein
VVAVIPGGGVPAAHADIRELGFPLAGEQAQATSFALARWEGSGVLLEVAVRAVKISSAAA